MLMLAFMFYPLIFVLFWLDVMFRTVSENDSLGFFTLEKQAAIVIQVNL